MQIFPKFASQTSLNRDVIGTCTKDFKEYDEILKSIRLKFNKCIKYFETVSTIDEYKYNVMYELINE